MLSTIWNSTYCPICVCDCFLEFPNNILESGRASFSNLLLVFAVHFVAIVIWHINGVAPFFGSRIATKGKCWEGIDLKGDSSGIPSLFHRNFSCL